MKPDHNHTRLRHQNKTELKSTSHLKQAQQGTNMNIATITETLTHCNVFQYKYILSEKSLYRICFKTNKY